VYSRDEAKETRIDVLHKAMRDIRLGTLVVADDEGLPHAAHVPFVLKTHGDVSSFETHIASLETHVARANPLWKLLKEPRPVLALFQGPQAYIRPSWYPAKKEHGKVVPTWSYVAVHARGHANTMSDMNHLLTHVRELSDEQERMQIKPWSVDDAPDGFISTLARGIVGITVQITALEGVWKMNQHRSDADREGTIGGLSEQQEPGARSVAEIMREIEQQKLKNIAS
jgi:transcriptional regulator